MIYFDNAATTPTFAEALDTFVKVNTSYFGNSESNHALGHESNKILEESRKSILSSLKLEKTHNLIFTSGATEANNLALKGTALSYQKRGKRIISSVMEHPSVLKALDELHSTLGFDVVYLPITKEGVVDPESLKEAMNKDTILVSIMAVNNELGSLNDIQALSEIVHAYPKAFFHVDATQSLGKVKLPYDKADLISFSAHKFGGIKGTGGLLYKKNMNFYTLNAGGEQEFGFRAGTVNVAGDAAIAKALELSLEKSDETNAKVSEIYRYIYSYLLTRNDVVVNSNPLGDNMTPFVLNFSLLHKKASVVVEALSNKGIYVSSVSACSSKEAHSSYVVKALGRNDVLAENSIRLSFGLLNKIEDAQEFTRVFAKVMQEVKDQ
jgi:cysteine desulfurase